MKISTALATLSLATLPALAGASPLLDPRAVPDEVSRPLAAAVRTDRARRPDAYGRVADLEGLRPEFYRRTRAGRPSVALELRGMGPEALLPMLDALALSGYPRALSAEEGAALRLGLLEAVGNLGDARSLPVLRGVFATAAEAPELRAAARGLARVCQDADRRALMGATGARRDPAAAALGLCAHPEAAQWLVAQLEATADPAHATALATGLAESASSWARPSARSAVDVPLRVRAARALLRRWRELPAQRDALGVAALSMGGAEVLAAVREAAHDAPAEAQPGLRVLERALVRDLGR
jgi:hypothetical protein